MTYINTATDSGQHYTGSYSLAGGNNRIITRRGLNQLYYSNYISASGYLAPNYNSESDLLKSSSAESIRIVGFDNFEESSFHASGSRTLTARGAVYSIPRELFGTHIEPGSVMISSSHNTIIDDGEGNLRKNTVTGEHMGNVIYSHGQLIITNYETAKFYESGSTGYAPSPYEINGMPGSASISFKNNLPIYTQNYNIKVADYEYNFTMNPTAQSGSSTYLYSGSNNLTGSLFFRPSGVIADNVTGSYFQPYITTVGLYNDQQELLAVGKLATPLKKPADTELTIIVRIDI
jgi:hypothetical protein